jgi:hypothetical protein
MYLTRVAHQCARQQTRLGEDLEAIADSQHQPAARGKPLHRLHDRRKMRNGAGAQVIAVGKPARNQHRVHALEILAVVPKKGDWLVRDLGDHVVGVMVAVRSGENQHSKFHAFRVSAWRRLRGGAVARQFVPLNAGHSTALDGGILPLSTGWSKTLTSPSSRNGEFDTKPICI